MDGLTPIHAPVPPLTSLICCPFCALEELPMQPGAGRFSGTTQLTRARAHNSRQHRRANVLNCRNESGAASWNIVDDRSSGPVTEDGPRTKPLVPPVSFRHN